MESCKLTCDRCGKLLQEGKLGTARQTVYPWRRVSWSQGIKAEGSAPGSIKPSEQTAYDRDLCIDCAREFETWMQHSPADTPGGEVKRTLEPSERAQEALKSMAQKSRRRPLNDREIRDLTQQIIFRLPPDCRMSRQNWEIAEERIFQQIKTATTKED